MQGEWPISYYQSDICICSMLRCTLQADRVDHRARTYEISKQVYMTSHIQVKCIPIRTIINNNHKRMSSCKSDGWHQRSSQSHLLHAINITQTQTLLYICKMHNLYIQMGICGDKCTEVYRRDGLIACRGYREPRAEFATADPEPAPALIAEEEAWAL